MDKDMDDVYTRVDWLHSEHYSAPGNIFGEPQKTARVGDEYQAQIPSLMTKNERLQLIELSVCHDANTDVRNHFEFGLSIPVTWVHSQHMNQKETMEIQAKGDSGILGYGTDSVLFAVPCSTNEESWSVNEQNSFLLGLYIFGKNLCLVNKFMGNKGMPHVISYYYGKFYQSSHHQKWSIYMKKRNKKSLPGKKILKGWRLQELLSRLLPNVTDVCKSSLTHIISTFEDGKQSFEEYVFTLRDAVGIDLLVEAVAIGKDKHDLTTKARRQLRKSKIQSACSPLKTDDILNVLQDRIGLSKARSKEVFWKGVWPRLLAKGWHFEQPTTYAAKHSLVFLAPGVKNFSRSLVKGSQYFDSLTEVLDKVASEPQLLENEVEPRAKQSMEDQQDLVRHTIVDTSVTEVVKARELTSLSDSEDADRQVSCSVSGETEQGMTEESQIGDKKIDLSTIDEPIRKLKLTCKQKAKRQRASTRNDNTSGENKAMEDPHYKKGISIVIDLNHPRVGPISDGNNSLVSPKSSVVTTETTTGQAELFNHDASNGQRQSTRNRPLTIKALEALANGFLDPIKKRKGLEERTPRRVRARTALVMSFGPPTLKIT